MNKLVLLILLLSFKSVFSQIQFIGFDRSVCPQAMNNTYTYSNFTNGGGSGTIYGYTIYKNGIAVFSASGNMGNGKTCKDLIFMNDSIGFLVYYSGNSSNRVLRTEDFGQTWNDIGGGAPNYFGLYVINSTTAYLVTQWDTPLQLYVARCCSLQSNINSRFIYDQTISSDIFVTDTLLVNDLCNQDSLNIYLYNGLDTITYHINLNFQFVGIQPDITIAKSGYSVYPNPSTDLFKLSISPVYIKSVSLLSLIGDEIISYDQQCISNNSYSLYNIPDGTYVVRIETEGRDNSYMKLVVNNHH